MSQAQLPPASSPGRDLPASGCGWGPSANSVGNCEASRVGEGGTGRTTRPTQVQGAPSGLVPPTNPHRGGCSGWWAGMHRTVLKIKDDEPCLLNKAATGRRRSNVGTEVCWGEGRLFSPNSGAHQHRTRNHTENTHQPDHSHARPSTAASVSKTRVLRVSPLTYGSKTSRTPCPGHWRPWQSSRYPQSPSVCVQPRPAGSEGASRGGQGPLTGG